MMKNEYSPHFSMMTPCSARYLVTMDAGMPVSPNLPSSERPGLTMVALIGSSMLKPGARSPKPCQSSSARIIQSSREPMPSSANSSGPQTLNHQSLPHSLSIFFIARRKSSASMIDSSTSAVPPGASIIAAATSHEAMIEYCGEVDVCIKYASLKVCLSSARVCESCARICEACDKPASNLCVDCVENTIDSLQRGRSAPMA